MKGLLSLTALLAAATTNAAEPPTQALQGSQVVAPSRAPAPVDCTVPLEACALGRNASAHTATDAERRALADLAYQVAMAIPDNPHRTERTRAQQAVAEWCMERGMLEEAFTYANAIAGWRRGDALARLGEKFLDAGDADRARMLAKAARQGADSEGSDWGRERMLAQVAALELRLGDEATARSMVSPESPVELSRFEAARTRHIAADRLNEQADAFDRGIASGNFDVVRACVDGYLNWLERTGASAEARTRAIAAIDGAARWIPVDVQISSNLRLAEWLHANGHANDATDRLALADKAFADSRFEAEYVAPVGVGLPMTRARMGAKDDARRSLLALQAKYESMKAEIPGWRRAISLRAIAEAWAALGDVDAAQAAFAAAVAEGAVNPNARPRAVDLSATILSMARAGVAPPPELRSRIEALRSGLVDPW
jgi:hypothetical protein